METKRNHRNIILSGFLLAALAFSVVTAVMATAPDPGHNFVESSGGIAQGDLLYGSAIDTLTALPKDANATRYLSNTGTTNNPAWAQVNVGNGVTGVLLGANGGTGVANTSKTITLGGNLTTAGAFNTTLTATADTNATLPAGTKTLVATDVATLSSLTSVGTIATGVWNATAITSAKIAAALTGKTYNGLSLTANASGFTIAGGTTPKTLIVTGDATISGTPLVSPMTTAGDIMYGGVAGAVTRLGGAAGFLKSTGAATPAWSTVNLASSVDIGTSVLGVANGGTGLATLTANNVILGNGTSTPLFVAPGATGNVLQSNGTTWVSAAGGGSSTLQSAYDTGATITATDARDLTFTMADTTTDPNFTVNLAGQGDFAIQDTGISFFRIFDDQIINYTNTSTTASYAMGIFATAMQSGNALLINGDALTTGSLIRATSSSAFSGSLTVLSTTGAATGTILNIESTNATATAKAINIDLDNGNVNNVVFSLTSDETTVSGTAVDTVKATISGSGGFQSDTGFQAGPSTTYKENNITSASNFTFNTPGVTFKDTDSNTLLTILDSGTTGDLSLNGHLLTAVHGNDVGMRIPTNAGAPTAVTGTEAGDIVYDTTGTTLYAYTGSAFKAVTGGEMIGVRILTSGTTYTPTAGTGAIVVELVGGGGAGGSCTNVAGCAGGGGGSGGFARYIFRGTIGTPTYALGAGGTAAAGATGGTGGNTTFTIGGVTITAFGGLGGTTAAGSAAIKYSLGGNGGAISTNGTNNAVGNSGGIGMTANNVTTNVSGAGANSLFGGGGESVGGTAVATSIAGVNGAAFTGSGGSGARAGTTTAALGGDGASGVILVWEYK